MSEQQATCPSACAATHPGREHGQHHPKCYQSTSVPDDLPVGICDCRVLRMVDDWWEAGRPMTDPMTAEHSSEEGGEGLTEAEVRLYERIEDGGDTQGLTHRVQETVRAHLAARVEGLGDGCVAEHSPASPACENAPLRLTDPEKAEMTRWITRNYGRAFEAVERILAVRLAAVQAEAKTAEQERDDWRYSAEGLAARAESAEAERDRLLRTMRAQDAANDALLAERDDLRGRLAALTAALGEYFDFDVDPWEDHDAACPAPEDIWRLHRDLRAAFANPGAAQGEGEA